LHPPATARDPATVAGPLVVNRKTAGTLGLTIPRAVLARADEIVD
jgi:ABC-type uncharacterized transport system substrate-binding protein